MSLIIGGFSLVSVSDLLHNVFMIPFCLTCSLYLMGLEELFYQEMLYHVGKILNLTPVTNSEWTVLRMYVIVYESIKSRVGKNE